METIIECCALVGFGVVPGVASDGECAWCGAVDISTHVLAPDLKGGTTLGPGAGAQTKKNETQ